MYKIIKGVANDKLNERYQPGDQADLKDWPAEAVDHLLAKGAIEKIEQKRTVKRGTSR